MRKRFNKKRRNVKQQSRSGSGVSHYPNLPKIVKNTFFGMIETICSTTKVQVYFSGLMVVKVMKMALIINA